MLHIHYYYSLKQTIHPIATWLKRPKNNIFASDKIIIPETGIDVFLSQEIANHNGIIANIKWQQPNQLINQLAHTIFPKDSHLILDQTTLFWQIMKTLPQILQHDLSKQLRQYLKNDEKGTKKYQLCQRIAMSFERYQIFRPYYLENWKYNPPEHWQALLWQTLIQAENTFFLIDFIQALENQPQFFRLPKQLLFVGFSFLTPLQLSMIRKLSLSINIDLYCFQPTIHSNEYHNNILYSSLAQPNQDLKTNLNDIISCAFLPPIKRTTPNLLNYLQNDVIYNQHPEKKSIPINKNDPSIQVHACHSPLREIEILHNQLLALFESDHTLKPQDILVMATNIDHYAAAINAVFSTVTKEREIPWKISDSNATTENILIQTFLALLQLPRYRLTNTEVLNWLNCPAILRCFQLVPTDLDIIQQWIEESNIRWGLNSQHKMMLNLPENPSHTWEFGLQRLLLGYALPTDNHNFNQIAPYSDVEGHQSVILGQLVEFITRLQYWHQKLSIEVNTETWFVNITQFLKDFFLADKEDLATFTKINDLLNQLHHNSSETLSYSVVYSWFKQGLLNHKSQAGFLKKGVTFCEFKPKRVISKPVIVLLGMNDGEFPRQANLASFDLIEQQKQHYIGDVNQRSIDRQLFLENIMATEKVLYISYIGYDQRDNSEKIPTVLVAELLDYLNQYYDFNPVVKHPLQAFSPRYFSNENDQLFSYAKEWLKQKITQTDTKNPDLILQDIELPEKISLDMLTKFYAHPLKYFCQQQLKLELEETTTPWDENEPFSLDNLQQYFLKTDLLSELLNSNKDLFTIYQQWKNEGKLPAAGFGKIVFTQCKDQVIELLDKIKPAIHKKLNTLKIELVLDNLTVSIWLENVYQTGIVHYRVGKVRPQDKLQLWIEHLFLMLNKPARCEGKSQFIGKDEIFYLSPIERQAAQGYLIELINLFLRGLKQPLPVLMNTSYEYAKYLYRPKQKTPLKAAYGQWFGNTFNHNKTGDQYDDYHRFIFRDVEVDDILNPQFEELAQVIFEPLFKYATSKT